MKDLDELNFRRRSGSQQSDYTNATIIAAPMMDVTEIEVMSPITPNYNTTHVRPRLVDGGDEEEEEGEVTAGKFQLFSSPPKSYLHPSYIPFIEEASTDSSTALGTPNRSKSRSISKPRSVSNVELGQLETETTNNIKILLCLFVGALSLVGLLYYFMPAIDEEDLSKLRLPRSLIQVRELSLLVEKYKEDHYLYVIMLFSACYIFLQSFAIPGSIFLSVLAGPLFGYTVGMILVSTVATTGSCICYTLAKTMGKAIIYAKFPDLVASFQAKLNAHKDHVFFYMLFLRVAPVLPNWFITVSSPIVGVPLSTFLAATFIGLMPNNYLLITAGLALNQLSSTESTPLITPKSMITLLFIGLIALVPVFLKRVVEGEKPEGAQGQTQGQEKPQIEMESLLKQNGTNGYEQSESELE